MPEALPCVANLRLTKAVVMTRTCEADKFSGVKRVYPALYLAPIRPLSDFGDDDEDGAGFAEGIAKGFPPKEAGGDRRECYRFAFIPACPEHGMEAGLICFREMQPVHLKYLVDAKKLARLSTPSVHAILERFQRFMLQSKDDDQVDNEPEGLVSATVQHYRDERGAEDTRPLHRNSASVES
ncbi:MAG TPA: hypothetical protein VFE16_10080 [Candidatus Cybelea sp.]|jgi:hypothetical protein|nr:hypothetical protein [Candidatus Cybelea sp.]